MSPRRRQEGIVLVMVLVFMLLLVSSVATFTSRAVLDASIVENRDAVARAETLARGGVQLGVGLLLEDRVRESQGGLQAETPFDVWARAKDLSLPLPPDARLRLEIEDAGARLNLNALFEGGTTRDPASEILLVALLERAIFEAELPEERNDDARELARNLVDWIDADGAALRGGLEDDVYQRQEPPYRAANRPLLSIDELGLVEGFDSALVEALRPYVTVYPYVDGEGINPNTAPPWVLGILYHGIGGEYRFTSTDVAEDVVLQRDTGRVLCPQSLADPACQPLGEIVTGEQFPPPSITSNVFTIRSIASIGTVDAPQARPITRTVEATVDRRDPVAPQILSWRVY